MTIKKVCIIGAGAAGLAAARHSIDYGLSEVDIYEQSDQVGGTWVYTDQIGSHSSIYRDLVTNLPKEVMQFSSRPFPDELPSFLKHEDVLEYLRNFATGLPIHYNSTVESVARNEEDTMWVVTIHQGTGTTRKSYDLVFVCNGHYTEPDNPYKGCGFRGRIMHSHDYRDAEDFRGKRVILIGAGPSGVDIAIQLSRHASEITLVSRKAKYTKLPENIRQIAEHVDRVTPNGCETESGELVTGEVIIVCTGYVYKFPFLSEDILKIKEDGYLVSPIYEHVVHANYPESLFFIGLNRVSITFPLYEYQVKLALAFATGIAPIPTHQDLMGFEERHLKHQSSRGLHPKFYHLLECEQWEYLRRIARIGRFATWKCMDLVEKMTKTVHERKRSNVMEYKKMNFRISENCEDFEILS